MTRVFHWQLLGVVALVAAVAACGGGSDQPSPTPATTPAPPATSTSTSTSTATATATATASPPPTTTPTTAPSPRATATATPSPTPTPATATPSPTPVAPEATTFRYGSYDTTGAVSTPGSYAFLSNPDDTSTVVTTYEALRDGTTTALLIHTSDAGGASRADVYDAVQVGDLFEWRKADDCFIRYTVTEVKPDPAGDVPKKALDVAWMTFTYTGCSGAISPSDDIRLVWGDLPNLGGESLKVPVIHGAYEIVPLDWEGETLREYVSSPDYSDPVETDDITVARTLDFWREPTLPEGWTFNKAIAAGGDAYGGASYGYCATWWATDRIIPEANYAHPQMGVEICADFTSSRYGNRDASWNEGSAAHETRVIAGRPAVLRFSPPAPNHHPSFPTLIEVFDPATEVTYEIEAIDYDLRSNPEAVVEMARSLFTPAPPATSATTFRYGTYDTTGAVSTPGSYAFLSNPDDTSTVVTTYEALRDGTTTALLIHTSDASGASRADVYDAVEAGDLFEWRQADDCFVRYTVTEVKPDPTGTVPRKLLAVEWMTYAFAGCSGTVPADTAVTVQWGGLADLGGPSLTAPVVHGVYQIAPAGWTGEVVPWGGDYSPIYPELTSTTDIAEARKMRHWREPAVPAGWTFRAAAEGGYEIQPRDGYSALYVTADGEDGFELSGAYVGAGVSGAKEAAWHSGASLRETRVVAGRPAVVIYSKASHRFPLKLWVYDPATQVQYAIYGHHSSLRGGNVDAVIAIAESLFTPAPPATSATTFRYDTYDTTGAVATPGSYAFLSNPDDTSTVVTTYEALRDGTTTALLIHTSDADGLSRADVYDTVEVGDLFEWREADDCFVRYTVTEVKPDPTGTVPRKLLAVEWMTYAFTGCGESIASSPVSIIWGPQPALGGDTLTVPVMVGIHQLVPENWTGAVRDIAHEAAPGGSHLIQQANPSTAVLSELDYWREPKIPEGWSLAYISAGTSSDPYQGFSAIYSPTEGIGIPLEFHGYFLSHRNWQVPSGSTSSGVVVEARVIAGRPALIEYSPPGDSNDAYRPTTISIMDLATESGYTLTAYDSTLKNIDTLIAIASSLFAEPPPGGE